MGLTAKQEKFCQSVAKGLNLSDSYRAAYDCANSTPVTVNRKAKELYDLGKISARIEGLKQRALKRYDLEVCDIIDELEEARSLAAKTKSANAMVSASMGKAKLLGLVVDKSDGKLETTSTVKVEVVDA